MTQSHLFEKGGQFVSYSGLLDGITGNLFASVLGKNCVLHPADLYDMSAHYYVSHSWLYH